MAIVLPADRLLTSPGPDALEVELHWKGGTEPDELSEVEVELLGSVLPELIAELMLMQGSTDRE
ncbi:MAG: hypothetical protein KGL36_03030 [Gammaproteobacteria bacterium]|nr:hypothetical protein [Gammaproteobacteria bacterium]